MLFLFILVTSFSLQAMEFQNPYPSQDTFNEPVIQPSEEKIADHWIITIHDDPAAPYLKKYKNSTGKVVPRAQWRVETQKRIRKAVDEKDMFSLLEIVNTISMTAAQETSQQLQELQQNHQGLSLKTKISLGITISAGILQLGLLAYLSSITNS